AAGPWPWALQLGGWWGDTPGEGSRDARQCACRRRDPQTDGMRRRAVGGIGRASFPLYSGYGVSQKTHSAAEMIHGADAQTRAGSMKNAPIVSRRTASDSAELIAVRRCDPFSSPLVYQDPRALSLLITQRSWLAARVSSTRSRRSRSM